MYIIIEFRCNSSTLVGVQNTNSNFKESFGMKTLANTHGIKLTNP